MTKQTVLNILPLLVSANLLSALGQEIQTGPAPGTKLTPVMAYGAGGAHRGPYDGRELDVIQEIGSGPGALLFVHEITRNILPVVRGLDTVAAEFSVLSFKSFTLLLHPDRSAAENRLKAVNGSLKLRNPMLLSLDGAEGPGNYALNRKAALSLILVNRGEVARSIALTDVNQEDGDKLRGWIEELAGKIPTDPIEYRRLVEAGLPRDAAALREVALSQALEIHRLNERLQRAQQQVTRYGMRQNRMAPQRREMREAQRPATEQGAPARQQTANASDSGRPEAPVQVRQGKPPEDPELNSLLRSFIRKTNDDARTDSILADIKKRADESSDLGSQAVEMFKLMLSFRDRYGTPHAQKLAENFLKANNANH